MASRGKWGTPPNTNRTSGTLEGCLTGPPLSSLGLLSAGRAGWHEERSHRELNAGLRHVAAAYTGLKPSGRPGPSFFSFALEGFSQGSDPETQIQ